MNYYKTLFTISLYLLLSFSNAVAQTPYGDIQHLINQGQYKEALSLTESQLAQNKSDIKLQFMKGLILTRLDQLPAAEKVFIQLTIDNPDLPEPYNNLAVVYAAQGKYREAEEALKSAINTHPSYATAHENLGDIYAKMASRAYNQALELDTSNQTAREKLSLVNELISAPAVPGRTAVASAAPAPAAVTTAPKAEEKTVVAAVRQPEIITIPAKSESAPVKPATKAVIPPVKSRDVEDNAQDNRNAVEIAIKNWANAWSAQDVDRYLGSYAQEFIPPKGLSRKEWEKDRHKRLNGKSFIKVTLSGVKINLHGKDYAEIKFTQAYQSDTYSDKVKKEILMRKVADEWLITQERTR